MVLVFAVAAASGRSQGGPSVRSESSGGFRAAGSSAISRTLEDKARDLINVKDYGAICDGGTTDDRTAIQAAIDAAGNGTVWFPGGAACGVSAPGIFLYPANTGITLRCQAQSRNGGYAEGKNSCLVAYKAAPPTVLLTNMAERSHLLNLYLDGNSGAAVHGLVDVNADRDVEQSVTTAHFSGSGMQIWNEGTPVSTLTADAAKGSSSFNVDSITRNRITFGQDFCKGITLDYGTPTQEALATSRVAGNTVITRSGALFAHGRGSTVRCHGHDNEQQIDRYTSYDNGGWGFEVIPGTDNNGIEWRDGNSNGNALGGEKWFGSVNMHYGGNYEADRGPAIQLGDSSIVPGTAGMYIGPTADMEEASEEFNAVWSVCDNTSRVDTQGTTRLIIKKGNEACSTYRLGSTTSGLAVTADSNGSAAVFITGANGSVPVAVYREAPTGRCPYPGEIAVNPNGGNLSSTYRFCIASSSGVITNAAGSKPVTLTTKSAPPSGKVLLSGFTGRWSTLNGVWTSTHLSESTFSIPADASRMGPLSGSPTVITGSWTDLGGSQGKTVTYKNIPTDCRIVDGTPKGCKNTTLTFIDGALQ